MRVSSVILALVAGSAMAAPTAPLAQRRSIPQLASSLLSSLSHGASSISSQLTILIPTSHADVVEDDVEEDEEYYGSYEEDILAWEDRHQQCAEVCRVRNIDGVRNGKEALCSPDGLESTLACAQCIDITWPEDMYENSAMSEYNRLALTCEEPSANGQFAI